MKKLRLSKEIQQAIARKDPIVALESTIISHGMPFPQNFQMALEVEKCVREQGATPATIAIFNGDLTVGLTSEEIMEFAEKGTSIVKVSRRDIPVIVSQKRHGATTVASTMAIAAMAGISVFATGGIGGVHRGAETTMDISADLEELANTNVAVVCAGAKSILDLGLTLEYLETKGVPVLGYKTNELPAFYTRESGFAVDYKIDTPEELAEIIFTKWELGLKGGLVITDPINEEFALNKNLIDQKISEALLEMNKLGIKGKDSTPFLLKKIKDLTEGRSLESNIQLVLNNARLAGQIAVSLSNKYKQN